MGLLLISGLRAPAIAEPNGKAVTQNINKLIKPTPPADVMGQKVQAFDAMVTQANQEYADEQSRLAVEAAQVVPEVQPPVQARPAAASGTCSEWMAMAGITDTANAYQLIMGESGCNPNSVNASSGACGLGQQLPCGKWPHQWNDPVGALIDMQVYVYATYGSWANAWATWQARYPHWY